MWWVWAIAAWLVLSVVAALAVGFALRRSREIDEDHGGPPC